MLSLVAIVASLSIPALMAVIRRARIEGASQTMTRLLLQARAEAVYRGAPVIVHPDWRPAPDGDELHYLVAWVDVDENGQFDGTIGADGTYAADPLQPFRSVDYPLYEWQLPYRNPARKETNIYFWAAADDNPTLRTETVDALTTKPEGVANAVMLEAEGYGDWEAAVVFLDNGSVVQEGAIRFGMGPWGGSDTEVNFLELRIAPRASGRIELRKFIPAPVATYEPKGYDDEPRYEWEWY